MIRYIKTFLMAALVAVMAMAAGCSNELPNSAAVHSGATTTEKKAAAATAEGTSQEAMTKMVVYVPTDDGRGVRPQSVTLDADKKTIKYALNVVFEEDARQKYPIFTKDTAVRGVTVKDGIATIDLTKPFAQFSNGGELIAQLRLAAVVNTATEFKDVKGVLITINGKPLKVYGAFDVSSPVSRMDNLIVK